TALLDVAVLRNQPTMFGHVASDGTMRCTFDQVGPVGLRWVASTRAQVRERAWAWAAGAGPTSDALVIDMDATIIRTKGRRAERSSDLQAHLRSSPSVGDGG